MALTMFNAEYNVSSPQLQISSSAILENGVTAYFGACMEDTGNNTNTCQPATGSGVFVGFCTEDNITGNAAGTVICPLAFNQEVVLPFDTSSATIGDLVYASDDWAFSTTVSITIVGPITKILDSGHARVKCTANAGL